MPCIGDGIAEIHRFAKEFEVHVHPCNAIGELLGSKWNGDLHHLAVTDQGKINCAILVTKHLKGSIAIKSGVVTIYLDDLITGLQIIGRNGILIKYCYRCGADESGHGGDNDENDKTKDHIHDGACSHNNKPLPGWFFIQWAALCRGNNFLPDNCTASSVILSFHGHIAADGKRPNGILCTAFNAAPQLRPHTKGKLLHFYMKELGKEKMAAFVQHDDNAKDKNGENNGFQMCLLRLKSNGPVSGDEIYRRGDEQYAVKAIQHTAVARH